MGSKPPTSPRATARSFYRSLPECRASFAKWQATLLRVPPLRRYPKLAREACPLGTPIINSCGISGSLLEKGLGLPNIRAIGLRFMGPFRAAESMLVYKLKSKFSGIDPSLLLFC